MKNPLTKAHLEQFGAVGNVIQLTTLSQLGRPKEIYMGRLARLKAKPNNHSLSESDPAETILETLELIERANGIYIALRLHWIARMRLGWRFGSIYIDDTCPPVLVPVHEKAVARNYELLVHIAQGSTDWLNFNSASTVTVGDESLTITTPFRERLVISQTADRLHALALERSFEPPVAR